MPSSRPRTSSAWLLGILVAIVAGMSPATAAQWPQFRGPSGLGYSDSTNLPLTWNGGTGENLLWQSPLVGEGHASPIVWEDAVFLCTVRWPSNTLSRELVVPEHHVTSYRVADGKLLWDTLVAPGPWLRKDFRSGAGGGYAAPTPATDGKRVYCAFGSSVLAALDFQGRIVWRKEIIPSSFDVTVGGSPVLYQDTVVFLCAMAKPSDSRVVAFDKATGEIRWQQAFPDMGFGHSTPALVQVNGQSQLLVLASAMNVAAKALRALDPSDGRVLWWCRGAGDAASPAYGSGIVYFDSGRGSQGVAVDPTGSGDVSSSHIRWTVAQVPEAIGSPIIVGQQLYRLHSPGILKCWDVATGKQLYAERLDGVSSTWVSPIADAAGHLYLANGGKSYVIQTGPEFRVLAVNNLGDANHASPAAANGRLFLAGLKNLYCLGQRGVAVQP
jgi:outer membrane protein assembly factor BamB